MSTLIVSLPPREPAVPLQEWQWPELPFALVDKAGHVQRAGRAALTLLPRANATVLIVAARDVLLLAATVPPLKGPKLRQALPNIVEDQLIQDPAGCHIALPDDTFVSQLHARVFERSGQIYVEDLGSTNGTYVNGHRVSTPTPMHRGDSLQVGSTVLEAV